MASKIAEAAAALKQPTNSLANNPFQSLRSGYNVAMYIVKEVLGLDPVIVVNLSIFFAALSTVGRYLSIYFLHYIKQLWVSSVRIHEDDHLYSYMMKWMTDHHLGSKRFRSVKAKMVQKTSLEDEEEAFKLLNDEHKSKDVYKDTKQLISYRTMMGRNPIQFQPYEMSHFFYHKRNLFIFRHSTRTTPTLSRAMPMRLAGELSVECLGRSLAPVQALLQEAQTYYLEKTMSTTNVFRANGPHWGKIAARPSRDIDTVILEKTKKETLLQDINEYLHPQTRRWYANHGIPYRRGYLFSGPPGTGKTSLTAALAGVFGLDIYVLTLLDQYMTEDTLVRLFSSVPSRCIVLLEDIDAAGLNRAEELKKRKLGSDGKDALSSGGATAPVVKPSTPAITLSGLLNAIDGVASSEGRILVMTTNKPKELDQALIRPGRVDMHITFLLPQRAEMTEMFLSMYRGLNRDAPIVFDTASDKEGLMTVPVESEKREVWMTEDELESLSERFADSLPENQLSLAAIQGFLLRHKHDPRLAVDNAREWAEESLNDMKEMQGES